MTPFLQYHTALIITLINGLACTTFNNFITPSQNLPSHYNLLDHYDSSFSGVSSRFDSGFSAAQFRPGIQSGVYPGSSNRNSFPNFASSFWNSYVRQSHHRSKRAMSLANIVKNKKFKFGDQTKVQKVEAHIYHDYPTDHQANTQYSIHGKRRMNLSEHEALTRLLSDVQNGGDYQRGKIQKNHTPFGRGTGSRLRGINAGDINTFLHESKRKALLEMGKQIAEESKVTKRIHLNTNLTLRQNSS